jgi:transcriptional regulator with XRE-family HTH domain
MPHQHTYSPHTLRATRLLGAQIRQARRERRWTSSELAERAGITRPTLHKIEEGEPTVGLGIAFEAAALLGVPLFSEDPGHLSVDAEIARQRLAVLPQRIRKPSRDVDDDF